MGRSRRGSGDVRSRLEHRRHSPAWWYDPIREEFERDLEVPELDWPEVDFKARIDRPPTLPRTRLGMLFHVLFVRGWMSVIFLVGLMLLGPVAWFLGYR